jgi:homoserine dehydrogenase
VTVRRPRPLRALWLGFGNVGRAAADILLRREEYPGLAEFDVAVVGIVTRTHGTALAPRGLDLGEVLSHWRAEGGLPEARGARAPKHALEAVRTLDYDVLVEMTPLTRKARGEPAITHVREALSRGRHVVSANKGPLAWAYPELSRLARTRRALFLHETAVMDGVPVFNLARHGLRGATVMRVEGILNSTTNAILGALESGGRFEEAVARAQRDGFAEADPRDDIEGWDAAVKLSALVNVLMGVRLPPEKISRESLAGLDPERAIAARTRDARLKVVAEAWRHGRVARGRVVLREVPLSDPFALVEDTSSILRVVTDLAGAVVVTEERPKIIVTGYGVISDLLTVDAAVRSARPAPRATGGGSRSRQGRPAR